MSASPADAGPTDAGPTDAGPPTLDASVVVPVYNPGSDLDACVESFLAQSMPADRRELILVDDGSTDDTPAKLDKLTEEHDNIRVEHIPNSGWPGRPRNVGIDMARGEYVQFVDQDDHLGVQALERLVAMGRRNHSDIVIGKVVSNFRLVPQHIWRKNVESCTIQDFGLWNTLTPHKMVRRDFMYEKGIRYAEGKRRLEDQLFMMQVYFAADVVSILGEYPCYYYWRRKSGAKHSGSVDLDPKMYYDSLRDVLDVVYENTEPGKFRDQILSRFARHEVLGARLDPRILSVEPAKQAELFHEVRGVLEDYVPASLQQSLPTMQRVRSNLVAAGDLEGTVDLAKRGKKLATYATVQRMRVRRRHLLHVDFEVELENAEKVPELAEEATAADHRAVRMRLLASNSSLGAEWQLPVTLKPAGTLRFGGDCDVDVRKAAGGRALPPGEWKISARLTGFGLDLTVKFGTLAVSSSMFGSALRGTYWRDT